MKVGEAIDRLVKVAEAQGFHVRQVAAGGAWLFKRNSTLVLVSAPKDANGVLDMLAVLVLAGLVWPPPE